MIKFIYLKEDEMPRVPVRHYNPPDDDVQTACGRKLAKTKWDTAPERVTCKACWKVMRAGIGPR